MLDTIAGALSARHASETRVRQFVADASHELRTPLAAIRGYTELAQRKREDLPEDVAHAMSRVESETERMTQLVGDMLLLARLDTGRPLEREQVDLSRLVVDAASDAHIAGPDHQWSLDLPDEPVIVVGDEARLHQVLANLLANARTHTPPGTSVTTSLVVDDSGGAVLTVADDGPGIPAWLQPEIFERFARGDSSRSRRGGSTGLGLAIVAAVVRAHGGTIDVRSVSGKNRIRGEASCRFTVESQRGQNRRLAGSTKIASVTTLVLDAEQTQKSPKRRKKRDLSVWSRMGLGVLLAATAALYLWNLSASGWANAFYSAAAQAGASDWTAMLFGSSDAANAITVDKTPAALWVIDVSVRLFGLNPWSVLVPQALEGVGAVALLYAAVRRVSGDGAALLAGAVFALTPVAALIFRFNNPDALLVLLLVAAAYCVTARV